MTVICGALAGISNEGFPTYCQVESHRKAAAATASGKFKDEIIPVTTKVSAL